MVTFITYINGSLPARPRTFKMKGNGFMNGIWNQFNRYAKESGFSQTVESGEYLGSLAWKNPRTGAIMELRKATEEDLRYLAAPTPEVFTTDYQFAHGRMPRGRGGWAFFMGSRHDMDTIFWTPSMTYAEAKALAIQEGKRQGVTFIHVGT